MTTQDRAISTYPVSTEAIGAQGKYEPSIGRDQWELVTRSQSRRGPVAAGTTALAVLRGEMDRVTTWRRRLDQTTNWAVVLMDRFDSRNGGRHRRWDALFVRRGPRRLVDDREPQARVRRRSNGWLDVRDGRQYTDPN